VSALAQETWTDQDVETRPRRDHHHGGETGNFWIDNGFVTTVLSSADVRPQGGVGLGAWGHVTFCPAAAAITGERLPTAAADRLTTLKDLVRLIMRFLAEGYSTFGEASKISNVTARSAATFLALLPDEIPLPRIAPDGEEGLILAWEAGDRTVLLTIDGTMLHGVSLPAQGPNQYVDRIPFAGDEIPEAIARIMPQQ
jgi:hypothetical protein